MACTTSLHMRLATPFILLAFATTARADEARGKQTFLERCSMCHGEAGDGQGPLAADLPLPPRNFRKEPLRWGNSTRSIVDTVTHGRLNVMPSFDGALTKTEIRDVADYVWSIIPAENKRADVKPEPHPNPTSRVFLVHQRGKAFMPSTLQAKVGDTLVFVNEDPVEHDVHPLDKEAAPAIRSQKPLQWDRVLLEKAGALKFGCAIHPTMRLEVKVDP